MKLSQPKSARIINTSRVLYELRQHPSVSRAELARILELNKVSVGEITGDLINKGMVRETGKTRTENGRRPTGLSVCYDSGFVLAVDIAGKTSTIAVCNLDAKPVKFERIPTVTVGSPEEFCVSVLKSCIRNMKLIPQEKFIGAGISLSSSVLPWDDFDIADAMETSLHIETVAEDATKALVNAEKLVDRNLAEKESAMYLNWGQSMSLAVISCGRILTCGSEFGKLQVSPEADLEHICTACEITGQKDARLSDIWENLGDDVFHAVSKALKAAYRITGAKLAVIGGEGASIPDACLDKIREVCPDFEVRRSLLGEKAGTRAAGELALDRFFYKSTMLDDIKTWV